MGLGGLALAFRYSCVMIPEHLTPLAEALKLGYGIDVAELIELAGGKDALAKTFKASAVAGEQYFVKFRVGMDPGISLCAALHDLGIHSVLAPIKTMGGKLAHFLKDRAVLVYPYKEGHNGFERPLELEHWQQIGEALRKIHDSRLPGDVLANLGRERFEVDGVEEFEATKARLMSGSLQSPAEEALVETIRANAGYIEHVVRRTPELGLACQEREWELVPCHADLHVGNVLIDEAGNVNLIDWDAPRLAPRECDLLFFCDGGILEAHGASEEANFFSGYGAFEPNPTAMTYYSYARVLEDFVADAREATNLNATPEERMEAVELFQALFRSKRSRGYLTGDESRCP